ncbi:uncharacterized protein LOC111250955 [Varroa destructor]|uniref:Lipocalin/cytosolic fatty-acid binding domain-containing protein n=1 Tax=Varroa destructor TaxID=109461 RepID=A0A7M7MAV3_VARDE|nr:uncharacterized protein LOC111250955 [Varroa destructor]
MTDEEWEEMIARRYDKIQEDKAKKRKAHKKRKNQQENKRKKDGFDHRHRHHHHHRYDADADKPAAQTISRPSVASLANVAKGVVQSVQKFGNDLSDATGQLFNNVNSMSPTLETWTKRGQEIADQIRGEGYTIEGELLTDAKGPHSLHMKTPSFEYRSPAYVIDTDYTNYAILWACQSNLINGLMRRENIWILSRTKTLDPSMKKSLIDRLRGKTYASYFLMPTDQTNCK